MGAAITSSHRVDFGLVEDSQYAQCRAWVKNDPTGALRTERMVRARACVCVCCVVCVRAYVLVCVLLCVRLFFFN
jgi:hypothetical protein